MLVNGVVTHLSVVEEYVAKLFSTGLEFTVKSGVLQVLINRGPLLYALR